MFPWKPMDSLTKRLRSDDQASSRSWGDALGCVSSVMLKKIGVLFHDLTKMMIELDLLIGVLRKKFIPGTSLTLVVSKIRGIIIGQQVARHPRGFFYYEGSPVVTIGFNTEMVKFWMSSGYPQFRKPPRGKFGK